MVTNHPLLLIGQLASALGAVLLIAGALHDVAARTIPNWVSLGLFVLGVVLRLLDSTLLAGLSLGLVVFAVAVFCWRRGWLGGGDVKLLAAAAIFVPPAHVGDLIIAVTLCGGVVGVIYLLGVWRAMGWRRAPAHGRAACSPGSCVSNAGGSAAAGRCLMPRQSPRAPSSSFSRGDASCCCGSPFS